MSGPFSQLGPIDLIVVAALPPFPLGGRCRAEGAMDEGVSGMKTDDGVPASQRARARAMRGGPVEKSRRNQRPADPERDSELDGARRRDWGRVHLRGDGIAPARARNKRRDLDHSVVAARQTRPHARLRPP